MGPFPASLVLVIAKSQTTLWSCTAQLLESIPYTQHRGKMVNTCEHSTDGWGKRMTLATWGDPVSNTHRHTPTLSRKYRCENPTNSIAFSNKRERERTGNSLHIQFEKMESWVKLGSS